MTLKWTALIIMFMAIFGTFTCDLDAVSQSDIIKNGISENTLHQGLLIEQNRQLSQIAKGAFPAVVNISSKRRVSYSVMSPFEFYFGQSFSHRGNPKFQEEERSLGSGFIISEDGLILTNHHVVENADEIVAILNSGDELAATLVGSDPKTDVALLKVNQNNLPYLDFANSDDANIGELVIALGNPFRVGVTVTMGVISGKGRNNVGINEYENFIQTDAAINPGNSGGPLLNVMGDVVGMNTAILTRSGGSQGVGFTIPANMLKPLVKSLRETGEVRRAFLGVSIQDMSASIAKAFDMPSNQKGALVSHIILGSPADKGGIEVGDIITHINKKPIRTAADLRTTIAFMAVDEAVQLSLIRDKKSIIKSIQLEAIGDLNEAPKGASQNPLSRSMTIDDMQTSERQQYQIPPHIEGVIVTSVEANGKADIEGLRIGDVILAVSQIKIRSKDDFNRVVENATPPFALLVFRRGISQYIIID